MAYEISPKVKKEGRSATETAKRGQRGTRLRRGKAEDGPERGAERRLHHNTGEGSAGGRAGQRPAEHGERAPRQSSGESRKLEEKKTTERLKSKVGFSRQKGNGGTAGRCKRSQRHTEKAETPRGSPASLTGHLPWRTEGYERQPATPALGLPEAAAPPGRGLPHRPGASGLAPPRQARHPPSSPSPPATLPGVRGAHLPRGIGVGPDRRGGGGWGNAAILARPHPPPPQARAGWRRRPQRRAPSLRPAAAKGRGRWGRGRQRGARGALPGGPRAEPVPPRGRRGRYSLGRPQGWAGQRGSYARYLSGTISRAPSAGRAGKARHAPPGGRRGQWPRGLTARR